MSGASITESFKARLETLIGDRGPKAKNAVLWSEIDKIYAEARRQAAGAATLPANINQIIGDAIGTSVTDAVNSSLSSVNQAISDMEADVASINSDIGDIETAQAQLAQNSAALTDYVDQTFSTLTQDIVDLNLNYDIAVQAAQDAEDASSQSEAARDAAAAAQSATEMARNQAQTSASNANGSAQAAAGSASTATTKATEAGDSATAAAASAVTATNKAGQASDSADAAATSATSASTSAGDASTSAAAAETARQAAQTARAGAEAARNTSVTASQTATQAASTATTKAGIATTAANNAGDSAQAAAGSANTATTKAGEAAQSASAANTSRTEAQAGAATATTKASEASTAATTAEGHAAAAENSRQISAQLASRGQSVITDQYLATTGGSGWTANGAAPESTVTRTANAVYPIGQTWRFTLGATDQKHMLTSSGRAIWTGQKTADAYVVEAEFDLEDGGLGGAGVRVTWQNTDNTQFSSTSALTQMISNPQSSGRMLARGVFRRPSNFSGALSLVWVMFEANAAADTLYGPRDAKTIAVHRVSIRVATAEEIGSGAVGAQIAASIAANDLVVVGREQAIAQSVTDLNAAMNTALGQKADASAVSTLTTRVTSAEGSISTMAGQISALSSDLSDLESLTTANADAVTGLATRVDSAEGSISALSTQQTTLSASVTGLQASVQGYQVALDQVSDVTVGAAVTVTLGPGAVGLPNTVQVTEGAVARSGAGQTNGASVKIPAPVSALLGGQRIKISVLALRPASNAAARFGIVYSTNGDGVSGYLAASEDTPTTPKWFSFYYTVPMPSAQRDHYIGLFGDNAKSGKATLFARVSVEIAAVAGEIPAIQTLDATVSDILAVKVDDLAGTALGTLLTQLDVQADGTSAEITAQGTALADLQGNAAASYVLRVGAGGASAGLELVAADNPTSGQTSALRVNADNILLDGTVTTKKLIVTDTTNLIPNPDFLFGEAEWFRKTGNVTFLTGENDAPVPTVVQLTRTTSETSITTHGNFSNSNEASDGIPINAGDRFYVEAWVKSSVAGAYWPFNIVQRNAATGAVTGINPTTSSPVLAAGTWTKVSGTITVTTSGTAFLRVWNNLNNSTLKATKLRLIKQSGGELLVDGGITAREVAAGAINTVHITAGAVTAEQVLAGTLTAYQIISNGISVPAIAGSSEVRNNSSALTTICATTLSVPVASRIEGSLSMRLTLPGTSWTQYVGETDIFNGAQFVVQVNGQTVASFTQNSLVSNGNASRFVATFTRLGISAGIVSITVAMRNCAGEGVYNSNLQVRAVMR